jgi:MscS family membrane protein
MDVKEGERQGQFLFSAGTVDHIREYYEEIRNLPYRQDDVLVEIGEYESGNKTEGFYSHYVATLGKLIPRSTWVGRLVDHLPDWCNVVYGGQTVWQWITLSVCSLAFVLVAFVVFRVIRRLAGRLRPPLDRWLKTVAPVLIAVILVMVFRFLDADINITGRALTAVIAVDIVILGILVAWAVFALFRAIVETIIASPKIALESVDASLLRIGARIVAFFVGAWIIVKLVQGVGADVVPLLAGLGVGGLAVALAAQRTLANFIGSLILFANKPIRVGDFCRYGDKIGTVEEIGLISTRIRSLDRTIITVPNAEFSEMKLENFRKRDRRLFRTTLQLRYETTAEQMRYVLARLRELLLGHPKVLPDPARVRFVGYGAYSKDVEIFSYLSCRDQNVFLAIQEDLLLRIEDVVNEAGTGFAFPSQTTYLSRDAGLNAERQDEAEARVEQWRSENKLPFPEFDEADKEQLSNVLDYPPEGSPAFEPKDK